MGHPINQVFLGGESYSSNMDLEAQIQALKVYEDKLQKLKNRTVNNSPKQDSLWDKIDSELLSLSIEQKNILFENHEYLNLNAALQSLVQIELLNLVKDRIIESEEGSKLLNSQLEVVKKLKINIVEESNRELELFKKFREFSKTNPEITYDEFIKTNK